MKRRDYLPSLDHPSKPFLAALQCASLLVAGLGCSGAAPAAAPFADSTDAAINDDTRTINGRDGTPPEVIEQGTEVAEPNTQFDSPEAPIDSADTPVPEDDGVDAPLDGADNPVPEDDGVDEQLPEDTGADEQLREDAGADEQLRENDGVDDEPCTGVTFNEPVLVEGLEGLTSAFGPSLSADGLSLYFEDHLEDGNRREIVVATRSSKYDDFDPASVKSPFEPEVQALLEGYIQGSPRISEDGLTLMFFRGEKTSGTARDIWQATRATTSELFSNATPVEGINHPGRQDQHASFMWDGAILFGSNRVQGRQDIFIKEPGAEPYPIAEINTNQHNEVGPAITANGTLIFFTRRWKQGGFQLMYSMYSSTWSAPEPLAMPNSEGIGPWGVSLSHDGRELFASGTRDGKQQLWRATRICD